MKERVTVVIPIYNALDDLKKCVDSVIQYTDFTKVDVMLIDDKSPDERIGMYLNTLNKDQFIIHRNEKNGGFSHNVNYGFQHSKGDVILLNTDTIVTRNWVEKLERCAYSNPYIATVTPFSNSATICSLPYFCEDNRLPKGFTVDGFAELIEKCSMHEYPEIPVAVGFCMYVKRSVIDEVGLFDEEAFERGYGEENDFCYRARLCGYSHVLCDDLFIYHSGTASFVPQEKLKMIEAHERILEQRYPALTQQTRDFVQRNPIQKLQKNVRIWMQLSNKKKNLLYIIHRDFREGAQDYIGGTQFHVKDLKNALCYDYNVFVLARNGEFLQLTVYTDNKESVFQYYVGRANANVKYSDKTFYRIYSGILDTFRIELIHVHHLFELSFDIFEVAQKRQIPIDMTIHDFYSICPRIKMLDENNQVCIGRENEERCRNCLKSQTWCSELISVQSNYLTKWRDEFKKRFAVCQKLFVPSESARDIFLKYYPEFKAKMVVIPHAGLADEKNTQKINELPVDKDIQTVIDSVVKDGDYYGVKGWSIKKNVTSDETILRVRILHEGNIAYEYECAKKVGTDISNHFGDDRYRMSRFEVRIPAYAAEYEMGIQMLHIQQDQVFASAIMNSVINGKAKIRKCVRKKTDLNVAFVGGMTVEKGSGIACDMIRQSSGEDHIHWFVFGGIGDRDLKFMEKKNLTKLGWYNRADITSLFKEYEIDLVCIPAIWPETFCYVLSEALLGGVPVVATDIGALGERVKRSELGWLVPPESDWQAYLKKIKEVASKPEELKTMKDRVQSYQDSSVHDMIEAYLENYQFADRKEDDLSWEKRVQFLMNVEEDAGEDVRERLMQAENELSVIKNTKGYKALQIFRRTRIPFKEKIVSLAYHLAKRFKTI